MIQQRSPAQLVNAIGKYLYKHIDSAYKIGFKANMCDIYITVYYQIPGELISKYSLDSPEVDEMNVNINITPYSDKIRVNIIDMSEMEKTIGTFTFKPENYSNDLQAIRQYVLDQIQKKLIKTYEDYEFIF